MEAEKRTDAKPADYTGVRDGIAQIISHILGEAAYDEHSVDDLCQRIFEGSVKLLPRHRKHVVTCGIVQCAGAGLHLASSSVVGEGDGTVCSSWRNDGMLAYVTVHHTGP
jgi:hypothetical protein